MIRDQGIIAGNVLDKYRTRNPISRLLVNRFLRTLGNLYLEVPASNALEVGCGEGDLCARLHALRPVPFVGTDVSERILDVARARHPAIRFERHDAAALGFADRSFDLVVACEVLEHLPDPGRALGEMARVARRAVLLSVPREPLWRVLNVCRGAYLNSAGNTPGHLQHWSRTGFTRFVSGRLKVRRVAGSMPWTIILAEPA